jgi:ribosome-interacting GTPase 1
MPANLSPEYKRAEADFRSARDPKDRLTCLREMLRTIPKHKGTEHLQADIKSRIKQLAEEIDSHKKAGGRSGPTHVIRAEGAAQIALIGPPNSGKSALHARLTGSHAEVGAYPFSTHEPLPGMFPYEDIHFQLIDLPPLSTEHPVPWIGNALQPADGCLLVLDLSAPDCVDQVQTIRHMLAERRVTLTERWEATPDENGDPEDDEAIADPFAITLPTLLVATKADVITDIENEMEVLQELAGTRFPAIATSVVNGLGLERLGQWLFEALKVVRVYTKVPGRSPEKDKPFTVRRGDTVYDVARLVHKEIADSFKFARLWGSGQFSGQQVGRDHVVSDKDVLELHA